jgi:hypothetical protein
MLIEPDSLYSGLQSENYRNEKASYLLPLFQFTHQLHGSLRQREGFLL